MNAFTNFVAALGFIDPYQLILDEPGVAEIRVAKSNVPELIKQWGDGAEVAGYELEYMGKQPATVHTDEYLAVYRVKKGATVFGYMEVLRIPNSQTFKHYVLIKLVTDKHVEALRRTLIAYYKEELREANRFVKDGATKAQVYHDHWHKGLAALQSHAYPEFFNY